MPNNGLAARDVRLTEHSGGVPDPEERAVSDVPEKTPAVELSGADAQLVIGILREWVDNKHRYLALRDARWMSPETLRERHALERKVRKVEWVIGWWRDLGGEVTVREGNRRK